MSAIRYDVSGRYAVAYDTDGKRLGWVISAQPKGASALLTKMPPDDLDETMAERIVEMTRARVQLARELESIPGLRYVKVDDIELSRDQLLERLGLSGEPASKN